MKPNVGKQEARIRIGIGIAAAIYGISFSRSKWLSTFLGMVAASGIETGLSRYCPMSEYLGIDNAPDLQETPIKKMAGKWPKLISESHYH